ncbi:2-isopropylmalate synthase [Candidatus Carsonella ruddii]|uniref:2-isopropylmalate synthase n=1 Tax=Candidatus Carsonella ruddii CE isolate Thao2000 TaxID=1202536 RepID=J7GS62_CARRU|nr:2-isopropylmalate synthase [Candidatus Carsonella ruddii]AFP83562.1 2-isopropylmalate synthase [Candidatus Carsonella ruddii CE isolate Thao2000]
MNLYSNYLTKSPIWVSEDLRDGNQALIDGLNIKKKIKIWNILIELGFKQIVLGFPSSNKHDYNFIKYLIKNKLIPNFITISILTPAKKNLIELSIKSVEGINNVIIHLYNSISKNQRKIVFKMNKNNNFIFSINNINYLIKKIKKKKIIFQYSPESFSDSNIFFSKKISFFFSYLCYKNKIKSILNLPITVENILPINFLKKIIFIKKNIINSTISVHTHNDMSNSNANSILSILFAADRIEGTLLGNGERAGNSSLFILANNFYKLGINPKIKIFNKKIINKYINIINIKINKRYPWFDNLNYVAFSGSHQDAIFKSFFIKKKFNWEILYISLNPKNYNFSYKNMIKINSQSGRGGIKFIFWYNYKLLLNNIIINKLYNIIQNISENIQTEIYKEMIFSILYNFSINILKKNKIIFFFYFKFFNFTIFIFVLKIIKNKIIKIILKNNE